MHPPPPRASPSGLEGLEVAVGALNRIITATQGSRRSQAEQRRLQQEQQQGAPGGGEAAPRKPPPPPGKSKLVKVKSKVSSAKEVQVRPLPVKGVRCAARTAVRAGLCPAEPLRALPPNPNPVA